CTRPYYYGSRYWYFDVW
nr:immunoglobulin heavy chain junction region [Mus musculus]